MDSIPVDYIVGDESLRRLEHLLKNTGWVQVDTRNIPVTDVLRRWLHEQEKSAYLRSFPFGGSFAEIRPGMYPPEKSNIQTITLDKLKLGFQKIASEELFDVSFDMDRYSRSIYGEVVLNYRAYVWAESESVQRQEVKYPADWWEAWKLRFAPKLPKWIQRRLAPVKYETVTLDVKAIYPTFKQKMPGHSVRLIVEKR